MGTGLDDTGLYKWYGWFCRWAGRTLSLMGVAAPMHAEPESDWRGVLGRRGEDEAAAYLRQQGYRIVARRARVLRAPDAYTSLYTSLEAIIRSVTPSFFTRRHSLLRY